MGRRGYAGISLFMSAEVPSTPYLSALAIMTIEIFTIVQCLPEISVDCIAALRFVYDPILC